MRETEGKRIAYLSKTDVHEELIKRAGNILTIAVAACGGTGLKGEGYASGEGREARSKRAKRESTSLVVMPNRAGKESERREGQGETQDVKWRFLEQKTEWKNRPKFEPA